MPCFFIGLIFVGASYEIPLTNLAGVEGLYLTGLIIYEFFFGSYACLTWVIPAEVYREYSSTWKEQQKLTQTATYLRRCHLSILVIRYT